MTVKDLAYFTDKNKSTIGRWIQKTEEESIIYKLQNATKDKPADFTIDEIETILHASSLSMNAVLIIMANARKSTQVVSQPSADIMMQFMAQMQKQQQEFMTAILGQLNQSPVAQSKALPAPKKTSRDSLRQLMSKYAQESLDNDYREAWSHLYEELYYVEHVSIRRRSDTTGRSKLDCIEDAGLLDSAHSIVLGLMGE